MNLSRQVNIERAIWFVLGILAAYGLPEIISEDYDIDKIENFLTVCAFFLPVVLFRMLWLSSQISSARRTITRLQKNQKQTKKKPSSRRPWQKKWN
ncbi:MAG: hypothetical protein ACYTFW_05125 [Planctomycetota bacterium]|jgi:hypothetical protein